MQTRGGFDPLQIGRSLNAAFEDDPVIFGVRDSFEWRGGMGQRSS